MTCKLCPVRKNCWDRGNCEGCAFAKAFKSLDKKNKKLKTQNEALQIENQELKTKIEALHSELTNALKRAESEVAKVIFEKIEGAANTDYQTPVGSYTVIRNDRYAELKKKHTEKNASVVCAKWKFDEHVALQKAKISI